MCFSSICNAIEGQTSAALIQVFSKRRLPISCSIQPCADICHLYCFSLSSPQSLAYLERQKTIGVSYARVSLTRRIVSITPPFHFLLPKTFLCHPEWPFILFLILFSRAPFHSLLAASRVTPKRASARFKPYGHVQKGGQTDGHTWERRD